MAIAIMFTHSMTASQYDEATKRLENAGASNPPGRLYHVSFGTGASLSILDVWESQDAFNAFGQTLVPILQQLGVDPGQPQVAEVHNIIQG